MIRYDIQQIYNTFVCKLLKFHKGVIEDSGLVWCGDALVPDISEEHVAFIFQGFNVMDLTQQCSITLHETRIFSSVLDLMKIFPVFMISDAVRN